jgi:hypothetical protein
MFEFVNTPTRFFRFVAIVVVLAAVAIFLPKFFEYREGVPEIATAVDSELRAISAQSESVRRIEFSDRIQIHTSLKDDHLSGYFVYNSKIQGVPAEIRVDWVKHDGAAYISQIQKLNGDARPTVVWAR